MYNCQPVWSQVGSRDLSKISSAENYIVYIWLNCFSCIYIIDIKFLRLHVFAFNILYPLTENSGSIGDGQLDWNINDAILKFDILLYAWQIMVRQYWLGIK